MAESYHAQIINGEVAHVEVVLDEFVARNSQRYTGTWIKVGTGSHRPYCGKQQYYFSAKDKIIEVKPYDSWTIDPVKEEWKAPKAKPADGKDYYWDEQKQDWFVVPPKGGRLKSR